MKPAETHRSILVLKKAVKFINASITFNTFLVLKTHVPIATEAARPDDSQSNSWLNCKLTYLSFDFVQT